MATLRAALDDGHFADVSQALQPDGSFTLTQAILETVQGGPLADGPHTLHLQAMDDAGNLSTVFDVPFTLDATPPAPTLDLAVTSDTGPLGDHQTQASRVTLVGATEPLSTLTLQPLGLVTEASGQGTFHLPGIELTLGPNPLTLQATDRAGNTGASPQTITRIEGPQEGDVVLHWNQVLLEAIRLDASPPTRASRALAMVHAAIYDTVNAIDGNPGYFVARPAPQGAAPVAAVAAAAHEVLAYLFPAQQITFDARLEADLAAIPDGPAETNGVALGQAVAADVIPLRRGDGWDHFVEEFGGTAPGVWQPTPPMFALPLDPQWAMLEPFSMDSPDQFRPAGPPPLDSEAYANAFNEVKSLGAAAGSTRTAEQTQIARFWADGAGTYTPPGHWNQIAAELAQATGNSLSENARLFAQLNIAMADAAIACWDVKYFEEFWRPVTAIREAADDGNPATEPDAAWLPLLVTPPFPEYTSGHSTFSRAAAAILRAAFGPDTSFTTGSFQGVPRAFTSFDQAAEEAAFSRVLGGIHFRFSSEDGLAAGRALAKHVLQTFAVAADTQAPKVIIESPGSQVVTATSLTIQGRVLDNLSGVALLEVHVNDGAFASVLFDGEGRFAIPVNFPTDGSADGTRRYRLLAVDHRGNRFEPTDPQVVVTVDSRSPVLTLTSPLDGAAVEPGTRLQGTADGTGSPITELRYGFDGGPTIPVSFGLTTGTFDQALDLSHLEVGQHSLAITARDAAGTTATTVLTLELAETVPFAVTGHTPQVGASDVGVTFRPKVFFSRAVDPTTLSADTFFATGSAGQKLPATIVPANDGSFAWLFFQDPMPGASAVTVHILGDGISPEGGGAALDANRDRSPGGTLEYTFTTVSLASVPKTTLTGIVADPGPDLKPGTIDDVLPGPDGVLMTADDVYLLPIAGVKVFLHGREGKVRFTDAQGRFILGAEDLNEDMEEDGVPTGNVKLVVDGMTATNAPAGLYFPVMVMDLTIRPGVANTVMAAMQPTAQEAVAATEQGVNLPRLRNEILQQVVAEQATTIGVDAASAPNLTPEQRQFLTLQVQPNSLVGPDGTPLNAAQIGLSTVPPELVMDMLPQGLMQLATTMTIQAPGIATFAFPLTMTFPNVYGAEPGTKLNFYSYDHTTGRLVIEARCESPAVFWTGTSPMWATA